MSEVLKKFKICDKIDKNLKQNIIKCHIFLNNILFITRDDEVYGMGANEYGCLGLGHDRPVLGPQMISELCGQKIQQFFIGWSFVLALNSDQHLYGWGCNQFGQLARGYKDQDHQHVKPERISFFIDKPVRHVVCGSHHTLALTADDMPYGWGYNFFGQIGCGNKETDICRPMPLQSLSDHRLKDMYCSYNQSFALTYEGRVYTWGCNYYTHYFTQTHPKDSHRYVYEPELIDIGNVMCVAPTTNCTHFLTTDGFIYFCGSYTDDDARVEKVPVLLDDSKVYESIHAISSYQNRVIHSTALYGKCVHYMNSNELIETKYDNYFDYYCTEYHMTFKTIDLCEDFVQHMSTDNEMFSVFKYNMSFDKNIIKFNEFNESWNCLTNFYKMQFNEHSLIGSGGSASVYKVSNKFDGQSYAIKKIVIENSSEENLKYVLTEVKTMAKLRGDYVVRYFSAWMESNDMVYIQMELCDESLKTLLELKPKTFDRKHNQSMNSIEYYISCEIFKEILECVQYLHALNPPVIHRDLKPQNILIKYTNNSNRFVRICDMGLAVSHDYTGMSHTEERGTFKYIAPEVDVGRNYTTKADVFSLGVIAQELYDLDFHETDFLAKYEHGDISAKITFLVSIIDTMILSYRHWKQRPNCEEVLSSYNEWSIDKQSVKDCHDFETVVTN